MEWAGIRGAMNEIIRMGQRGFSLDVKAKSLGHKLALRH